jgi:hypothetical protein
VSDKKFKQSIVVEGDITSTGLEANRALTTDGTKKIVESATTATELGHLSGVTSAIQTQLDAKIDESREGQANGVATLDAGGKVPVSQLPASLMEFKGTWDASTNTPTLANGTGDVGDVYVATPGGTVDFGAGAITFASGDWVIYNGTIWQKSINSNAVASVFSRTGVVTAQSGDYTASQVTNTPAGTIAATTVQAAINELDGDVVAAQADATQALADAAAAQADAAAAQADIDNHIADATAAHAASAVSNTPSGNLAATDVQAALNELQSDVDTRATQTSLDNHVNDVSDAHDASAISVVPAGNLTSTDVQAALEEIQTELDNFNPGSAGDISETSFALANNQASAANVTGLAFSSAVRSFDALVSVEIDAASDLYEGFKLHGIRRGADWQMTVEGTGDNSLVAFTITSGGQVQYTSADYVSFVSGAIKFRAITLTT